MQKERRQEKAVLILFARSRCRKYKCWSSCISEIHVGWNGPSISERKKKTTNKQT